MDGDAPESTDPISLARQVVEDAIKLARAELNVIGAELKRAVIQLVIAMALIIVAAVFLLIAVIEALGALPSGLDILGPGVGALAGARRGLPDSRGRAHLLRTVTGEKGHQARAEVNRRNVEGGCRVAPGTDEAQRQRELTKQALARERRPVGAEGACRARLEGAPAP